MKYLDKKILAHLVVVAAFILAILYWQSILVFFESIWSASSAVINAAIYAYVLNLLMKRYEHWFFSKKDNKFQQKFGRILSIFLAIFTFAAVIILVVGLVLPQLVSLVATMIESAPRAVEQVQKWVENEESWVPFLGDLVEKLNFDWGEVARNIINSINNLTQDMMSQGIGFVSGAFSSTMNFVLSLMLAIYFLLSKEKLYRQFNTLMAVYLPESWVKRIRYISHEFDRAFENFLTGAVVEATILGSLVATGMFVLRLPYPAMIGVVTGVLALLPMVGAYISATIGFIMILAQSPSQAFIFLIFILVIQQFEGNFVYPKVVGGSIGLPGMWVLVAVTIGGGLFGVTGMLVGVPFAAALYSIIKADLRRRQAQPSISTSVIEAE